ncbi:MAG: 1,4-alpha-glucan branching enzyme [Candidatus Hydrogenedentes bacterium]|nr:1,4-alpha-glucan branching enzyme [Candidatus Hydrogenedentota bacterium]
MYQDFGARELDDTRKAVFRLFIPDSKLDPGQYNRGTFPSISKIHVIGDFQSSLGGTNWSIEPAFEMQKAPYTDPSNGRTKGWLYQAETAELPEGFYQYKFYVTFASGTGRHVCDPCTRYGGTESQNSGVVIGGPKGDTKPLAKPLPLERLIMYELMIDDFTAEYRGSAAPLAALVEKLDYIKSLGVNAIEFMPWTQWPGTGYNWGYEPQDYFAVAHPYTLNPQNPAEKLFLLKRLISECHARDLHVIFDGVFNHVTSKDPNEGWGYRWLWENPEDSPYCGKFADAAFYQDLDYANTCTLDFATDVCLYWIDTFSIDGIRFDCTSGFYDSNRPSLGLPGMIARLKAHLASKGLTNFPLILEHKWEYSSIDTTNRVNATSCWLDPFRSATRGFLTERRVWPGIMRLADAARDFNDGRTPITYIENHDHESFVLNAGSRDEWWRTQPYAIMLFTTAGCSMIHNGQEFAELYRMPESDHGAPENSLDPAVKRVVPRPLRWSHANDDPGLATLGLYRRLIGLRDTFPSLASANFHPRYWEEGWTKPDADGFGIDIDRQTVVYHRWGNADDGRLEKFYVVLNFSMHPQEVLVTFPENDGWEDFLSGWRPAVHDHRLVFQVGSNWGHVFYKKY